MKLPHSTLSLFSTSLSLCNISILIPILTFFPSGPSPKSQTHSFPPFPSPTFLIYETIIKIIKSNFTIRKCRQSSIFKTLVLFLTIPDHIVPLFDSHRFKVSLSLCNVCVCVYIPFLTLTLIFSVFTRFLIRLIFVFLWL